MPEQGLPSVGEAIAPILARVAREEQPLLIAYAERLAAERYRGWARAEGAAHAARLLACAAREEEIARRVEALHADAALRQRRLLAEHPGLLEVNRGLFAGRAWAEQLAIQAAGERLGAATWRSFARKAEDTRSREALLACAELEEASARVLEEILDGAPRPA
jgi:bacterioferritin (cytochrome b1)